MRLVSIVPIARMLQLTVLVGPMFLAPFAEVPPIGRKLVYLFTLSIFVFFNFAVVYAPNIATLLVFRFLTVSIPFGTDQRQN